MVDLLPKNAAQALFLPGEGFRPNVGVVNDPIFSTLGIKDGVSGHKSPRDTENDPPNDVFLARE